MTTDLNNQAITVGVIEALSDDKIVLKITGTDYQLHLLHSPVFVLYPNHIIELRS